MGGGRIKGVHAGAGGTCQASAVVLGSYARMLIPGPAVANGCRQPSVGQQSAPSCTVANTRRHQLCATVHAQAGLQTYTAASHSEEPQHDPCVHQIMSRWTLTVVVGRCRLLYGMSDTLGELARQMLHTHGCVQGCAREFCCMQQPVHKGTGLQPIMGDPSMPSQLSMDTNPDGCRQGLCNICQWEWHASLFESLTGPSTTGAVLV